MSSKQQWAYPALQYPDLIFSIILYQKKSELIGEVHNPKVGAIKAQ